MVDFFTNLFLYCFLIFAIIAIWPRWAPNFAQYRFTVFAISWFFYACYVVLTHSASFHTANNGRASYVMPVVINQSESVQTVVVKRATLFLTVGA